MSTVTYLSGHVIPPDLNTTYVHFPLYHIWIALSSHVMAIDIQTTLFLITCPVYVIAIIFLYYLFKQVTVSAQISLLACLLYSIDSTVTFYGAYMVTRAAAYIGFVILLYLLIFREKRSDICNSKNTLFRVLAILMTVYILLVHQVSTPMILSILLLLLCCEWFVGSEKHLRSSFFVFEVVVFLAYWLYVAFDFSNQLGISRIRLDVFQTPIAMESVRPYSPLAFLFNNVDILVFLFFAIVGIGYLLWKQKPAYASVLGLFALITIIFYIPTPLKTLWQIVWFIPLNRLMLFISPFMAIIMGWGLHTMLGYLQRRSSAKIAISTVLLLFIVYCCGATGIIMAEEDPESRISFTSGELDGFDHISSYVPYGSTLYSDYYTSRYFNKRFSEADILGIPFYNSMPIGSVMDLPSYKEAYVIIPYSQFQEYGLIFRKGNELNPEGVPYPYLPSNETVLTLTSNLAQKDKIFSSKFIELYRS